MPVFKKLTESDMSDALISLAHSAALGIASGACLVCVESAKVNAFVKLSDGTEEEDAARLLTAVDASVADMTRALASREICVSDMLQDASDAIIKIRESEQ
ncbi:MAG: hypothetical protein LBD16_09175 [Oscillospiraceae bacterium]|jgi:hypothetical protein|nr:hypothetical protein [Oscillospiraceae bacterium]